MLLLREKIASINRKIYWQAREKFFVGLPEKKHLHYQALAPCYEHNLTLALNFFTFHIFLNFVHFMICRGYLEVSLRLQGKPHHRQTPCTSAFGRNWVSMVRVLYHSSFFKPKTDIIWEKRHWISQLSILPQKLKRIVECW